MHEYENEWTVEFYFVSQDMHMSDMIDRTLMNWWAHTFKHFTKSSLSFMSKRFLDDKKK